MAAAARELGFQARARFVRQTCSCFSTIVEIPMAIAASFSDRSIKSGFFFVFQKWLRAQRAGRVAPRRGGAKRRAAALGAAQRPKAPPQAAERRAAHEACSSAFNFAPIIDKEKELTEKGVGNCPIFEAEAFFGKYML